MGAGMKTAIMLLQAPYESSYSILSILQAQDYGLRAHGIQKTSVMQISFFFCPRSLGFHSFSLLSIVTSVSCISTQHLDQLVVCQKFLAGLLASTTLGPVTRLLFQEWLCSPLPLLMMGSRRPTCPQFQTSAPAQSVSIHNYLPFKFNSM